MERLLSLGRRAARAASLDYAPFAVSIVAAEDIGVTMTQPEIFMLFKLNAMTLSLLPLIIQPGLPLIGIAWVMLASPRSPVRRQGLRSYRFARNAMLLAAAAVSLMYFGTAIAFRALCARGPSLPTPISLGLRISSVVLAVVIWLLLRAARHRPGCGAHAA